LGREGWEFGQLKRSSGAQYSVRGEDVGEKRAARGRYAGKSLEFLVVEQAAGLLLTGGIRPAGLLLTGGIRPAGLLLTGGIKVGHSLRADSEEGVSSGFSLVTGESEA